MKVIKKKDLISYLESFEQEYILSHSLIELTPIKDLTEEQLRNTNYIYASKYDFKYHTEMEKKGEKYCLTYASKYTEYGDIMRKYVDMMWYNVDYKKDIAKLEKKKAELESEMILIENNDHLSDKGKRYQRDLQFSILEKIHKAINILKCINAENIELDERIVDGNILLFLRNL